MSDKTSDQPVLTTQTVRKELLAAVPAEINAKIYAYKTLLRCYTPDKVESKEKLIQAIDLCAALLGEKDELVQCMNEVAIQVVFLDEAKLKIDFKKEGINDFYNGKTLLMHAIVSCKKPSVNLVRLLVRLGADATRGCNADSNITPLTRALQVYDEVHYFIIKYDKKAADDLVEIMNILIPVTDLSVKQRPGNKDYVESVFDSRLASKIKVMLINHTPPHLLKEVQPILRRYPLEISVKNAIAARIALIDQADQQ